jgi:hypothetical protein
MFGADENVYDAGKLHTVITDPPLDRLLVDLLGVDCSDRPPAAEAISSGSRPRERSESREEGPEDPWAHLPLTPWATFLSLLGPPASHSLAHLPLTPQPTCLSLLGPPATHSSAHLPLTPRLACLSSCSLSSVASGSALPHCPKTLKTKITLIEPTPYKM